MNYLELAYPLGVSHPVSTDVSQCLWATRHPCQGCLSLDQQLIDSWFSSANLLSRWLRFPTSTVLWCSPKEITSLSDGTSVETGPSQAGSSAQVVCTGGRGAAIRAQLRVDPLKQLEVVDEGSKDLLPLWGKDNSHHHKVQHYALKCCHLRRQEIVLLVIQGHTWTFNVFEACVFSHIVRY